MNQTIGEKILLTIWIGALWTIGFLVVPILFASLDDKQLAGMLAGKMFTSVSYIGLFCGLILLITELSSSKLSTSKPSYSKSFLFNLRENKRFWILSLMLFLVVVGEFIIQPQMAALKQTGLVISDEFNRLHGIVTVLYMLNCLFGLILIVYNPPRKT